MAILSLIATKAKEHAAATVLLAITAGIATTQDTLSAFVAARTTALELSKYLVLLMSLVALCLAWVAYLCVRLASRANVKDFAEYHPAIGVTVFRQKPKSGAEIDTDVWYCPRCLTVDHKLAHVNSRHDKSGMWQCVECKLEVHCFTK